MPCVGAYFPCVFKSYLQIKGFSQMSADCQQGRYYAESRTSWEPGPEAVMFVWQMCKSTCKNLLARKIDPGYGHILRKMMTTTTTNWPIRSINNGIGINNNVLFPIPEGEAALNAWIPFSRVQQLDVSLSRVKQLMKAQCSRVRCPSQKVSQCVSEVHQTPRWA